MRSPNMPLFPTTSLNSLLASAFLALSVAVTVLASSFTPVQASIYAGSNSGWVVIASRSNANDAITLARRYARKFPSVVVFQSSNGYFGVSLGWASRKAGKRAISVLSSQGLIAGDSYVHSGERWVRAIWSASNAHNGSRQALLNSTRIVAPGNPRPPTNPTPNPEPAPNVIDMAPTNALVHGLKSTGDNYLSLRKGPGTNFAEIARMRSNTGLTIDGRTSKWYRVTLSNGMSGWAFSKYVKIAEVPLVGPDNQASNDVPTIGPDEDEKPKPQQQANNDQPKEPDISQNKPDDVKAITDEKRVALVLGNSKYEHTSALANPKNDADAISSKLEGLGFTVIKGLDLDKVGMEKAVREFVRILPGSDVALFFYAGHAMQVNGKNFLIPVNAKLEDETAIDFETINLGVVLEFMNDNDRTSIALLDACRNNPLARSFTRKLGKSRSGFVGRGLAAPNAGDGQMLIGFATAPGEVALDGDGDNSPFTTALLKHIETPGVEIESMLKRVKSDVFDETEGSQSPWHNSALRREFFFAK